MTKFCEEEFSSRMIRSASRRRDKTICGERYNPIIVRSGRSFVLITVNSTPFITQARGYPSINGIQL